MTDSTKIVRGPRRGRRALIIVAALLGALVLGVLLLPTILSAGFLRGSVARALEDATGYDVEIDAVRVRWGRGQRADAVRLLESDGTEVASFDARLDQGLMSVLRSVMGSGGELGPLHVTGRAQASMTRDGVIFPGTQRRAPAPQVPAPGTGARSGGTGQSVASAVAPLAGLLSMPALSVQWDGIDVTLLLPDDAQQEPLRVRNLRGMLHAEGAAGGRVQITLDSDAAQDLLRVQVAGLVSGFVGASGSFTPDATLLDVTVTLDQLRVPYGEDAPVIERALLRVSSDRLTERALVELTAHESAGESARNRADGHADSEPAPVRMRAALAVRSPVDASGALTLSADRVDGTASATAFPLALLQPLFASTGVRLTEHVGPRADVNMVFARASVDGPAAQRVSLEIAAERLSASLSGDIDGASIGGAATAGTLRGGEAQVRWDPGAGSVERLSEGRVRGAERVVIHVQNLTVPLGDLSAESLLSSALSGSVRGSADGPVEMKVADVDGPAAWLAIGDVQFEAALLRDAAEDAPRDSWTLQVHGAAAGSSVALTGTAHATSDLLETGPLVLEVMVDPAVAAAFVPDGMLVRVATLRAEIDAMSVAGAWWTAESWKQQIMRAVVTSERVGVQVPGAAHVIDVSDLRATVQGSMDERAPSASAEYEAVVSLDDEGRIRRLFVVSGNAERVQSAGKARQGATEGVAAADTDVRASATGWTASVQCTGIRTPNVERLLSMTGRTLVDRLGDRGTLRAHVNMPGGDVPVTLRIEPDFPLLTGVVPITLREDRMIAESAALAWTMSQSVLQAWLDGTGGDDPSGMRIAADARADIAVTRADLPFGLFTSEAIDPASAAVIADLQLSGVQWTLASAPEQPFVLEDAVVRIDGPVLAEGAGVEIAGAIREGRVPVGSVALSGRVHALFTEGLIDTQTATVTMSGSVQSVPSHVLDRLTQMNGFLTAAIGDTLTADLDAQNLSRTCGSLDLQVRSPASKLTVRVLSRDQMLVVEPANPLTGELELTLALRERLLRKIHPIFADVRTTQQPLRVRSVEALRIPADGDPSRLDGRLEITVGDVEFDGGSSLLSIFALFGRAERVSRFEGSIDPIDVRIRSGIIDYESFIVRVDKLELRYRGRIDLVNQTADLRMDVPLSQIAHGQRELDAVASKISVPIVTRGALRDLRTRIDPDFDIGKAALEAGVRLGLEELLGGRRSPVGGLLEELLRRPPER